MSLPVIAIIIASVSALFTGVNVTVSLATFRRARPRVVVRAYWNPYSSPDEKPETSVGYFVVQFINKSQTAARVEWLHCELDRGHKRQRRRFRKRAVGLVHMKAVEGKDDQEIPPFGGVTLLAQTTADMSSIVKHISRARLYVTLTNGHRVRTRWIPKDPLRLWVAEELSEELYVPDEQLSFDDLEEAEG